MGCSKSLVLYDNNIMEMGNDEIFEKALNIHNEYRKKHNAERLELSVRLSENAKKRILQLEKGLDNINSKVYVDDHELGENLYISTKNDFDIEKLCEIWYNEKNKYNFDLNTYQKGTGHFTQMIWKDTRRIGFGYLKSNNGKIYFLALYSPAGNELFKFKENVEKASDDNNF